MQISFWLIFHQQNYHSPTFTDSLSFYEKNEIKRKKGGSEEALSISDYQDFQIHYRRLQNSCFLNNYFCDALIVWDANTDIKPVFHQYKAVANMCAYLSKPEDKCSLAMTQTVRDVFEKELDNHEQMKSLANIYLLYI